jgi:hypothetical protein
VKLLSFLSPEDPSCLLFQFPSCSTVWWVLTRWQYFTFQTLWQQSEDWHVQVPCSSNSEIGSHSHPHVSPWMSVASVWVQLSVYHQCLLAVYLGMILRWILDHSCLMSWEAYQDCTLFSEDAYPVFTHDHCSLSSTVSATTPWQKLD